MKRWFFFCVALAAVALAAVAGLARPAGSGAQTCQTSSNTLLLVGYTLTFTAGNGDENDFKVEKTGGTFTPFNTNGIPLTQATYRITERGAGGFSLVDTSCASDPAASCAGDPNDAAVVNCTAIIEEFGVFVGDRDDRVDMTGVPAPAVIGGGGDNDILRGGDNDDSIGGGDGGDELYGGPGVDLVNGGPVGDYLEGGPGDDNVAGGAGDDMVKGGTGHDTLAGGAESDTVDYSDLLVDVIVDLQAAAAAGTTSAGPAGDLDTISNDFENVAGGSGNDTLLGQDADVRNILRGGGGDDLLNGGFGQDVLEGGDNNDILLDTNEGEDFTFSPGHTSDTFSGGDGNDRLVGGTGDNQLSGDGGNDWLISGCANDANTVAGTFEGSTLDGGPGDDTLSNPASCALFGSNGRDTFIGGPGENTIDFCAEDNPRDATIPVGYRPLARRDWTNCARAGSQTLSIDDFADDGFFRENDKVDMSFSDAIGGAGNDTISRLETLGAKHGYLNGATGTDLIEPAFADVADGGPGGPNDVRDVVGGPQPQCGTCAVVNVAASYELRTAPLDISLDDSANDGESGENDNVLADGAIGGSGNDTIRGRSQGANLNTLEGRGGNDKLYGLDGHDSLYGGEGDDLLEGGPGPDILYGQPGSDEIRARDGSGDFIDCGGNVDSAIVDRVDYTQNCEDVHVGVEADVFPGDSLSSDTENDGATAAHPIEVQVTPPNGGHVELEERATTTPSPTGYTLLGTEYVITAPAASAGSPLQLVFRIDASKIPAGQTAADIVMYRNGVAVPDCKASPPRPAGTADPDPCVVSRSTLADGDAQITVLASTVSTWNAGVDVTPPSISILRPLDASVYLLHEVVHADYSCSDDGSGIDPSDCVGTVADGTALATSPVGAKTFTVNATDRAGNTSSQTNVYRVIYDFRGFFSPLDNPGHVDGLLNSVKAGAAVPVRFSLAGDQGLAVFDAGFPASKQIGCDGSATPDPVEETVTADASGLKYDPGTQTYQYVWKTDKAWAGTCRELNVRLNDGTDHVVDFEFLK